jgi:M6 family metalloprotease-like protein
MKIAARSILILFLFLISACQSAAPVATITPSPMSAPTDTPIPTVMPTTVNLNSVAACKLPVDARTNVGLGFPRIAERIPSTGEVKTIVLFVDFSDAPASQTPEEILSVISPGAEEFYKALSYGRMDFALEPHLVWLRLSQPSARYAEGLHSFEGHQAFIQEAVDLADPEVDFSSADLVVVMANPQATALGFGPAFGGDPNNGIRADGVVIPSAVTSGADLLNWGFLWLNHETGHTMSLVDLYDYGWNSANYDELHKFVGNFGLMGYIGGTAPEFFAFERWMLGWLDDEQIVCQQTDEATTILSAIETAGGAKAVIIPINRTKAVVVESRRALGYDGKLIKSGALVYTVDTSIYSGAGTIVVYPILDNDPYRDQSPLAVGESVTVENVTITVVDATDQSDIVKVTVAK